jgi:hypothetical protein
LVPSAKLNEFWKESISAFPFAMPTLPRNEDALCCLSRKLHSATLLPVVASPDRLLSFYEAVWFADN